MLNSILGIKKTLVKLGQRLNFYLIMRKVYDFYEKHFNDFGKYYINKNNIIPGWSIVVITNGKSNDTLEKLINSVEKELKDTSHEIIIVGPADLLNKININAVIKHIPYKEPAKFVPGWITRKKNIGVLSSRYDKVVVCHDYILFKPGWKAGFDNFGDNFDVCLNAITNPDGQRNRDWIVWDYPGLTAPALLPYSAECTKYQLISGAYFVIKNLFYRENMLNEKLRWGEGEDVEWSFRIRQKTIFKFNPLSPVMFQRQKKLAENWIENTIKLEKILQLKN